MRNKKAKDYWNKIYLKRYTNYIDSLIFNDCNGFTDTVKLEPGITAICGLNGVGKSSVISSIAKLLGIPDDSVIRKSKFHGEIKAQMIINGKEIPNISEDSTAIENGLNSELVRYIDSDLAIDCIKYWEQDNIEELIASEEEYKFNAEQIEAVNQIIGKNYDECTAYVIEDSGQSFTPVYFKIRTDKVEYGSQEMGIGEHFLLYLYYILISQIEKNSILIIEEPESYISIHSQKKLLNYVAKTIVEKNLSVLLTTHSPFILSQIQPKNIRIITNRHGKMQIQIPNASDATDKLLGMEYRKIINDENKIATLFVEDYAARLFLASILKHEALELYNKVDIVSLNGESDITTILKFDIGEYMSHTIVGVYDGDMRQKESSEGIDKKAKLPYCFLPIEECIEIEMQKFVENEEKSIDLQSELGIETSDFNVITETLNYEDHHDWFLEFCRSVEKSQEEMIDAFYNVWSRYNEKKINKFVSDIQQKVLKESGALIQV
ncbi:MAG: ATP-dependent nuclease [Ruminococcus sp.]